MCGSTETHVSSAMSKVRADLLVETFRVTDTGMCSEIVGDEISASPDTAISAGYLNKMHQQAGRRSGVIRCDQYRLLAASDPDACAQ